MTPANASPAIDSLRLLDIAAARRRVIEEGGQAEQLAPWIARSWQRCLGRGQQPRQAVVFDAISAPRMRHVQDENQPLLAAAAPALDRLARAMADTRYFAILTDAQGVVIQVDGPVDRADPRADAIARIGVDLSEPAVGTTAIGAALAELQPVWLHRGEHFFDGNGHFSCAGAPVWGPHGECVGMLDLTGVDVAERPALKHLVTQSARGIENAMALASPHELLLRLNWPGLGLGDDGDGLLCIDAEGQVVARNRAASDMLSLPPGTPHPHLADLFALPWEQLFDAARGQRGPLELPLWSGLRLQVLARSGRGIAESAGLRAGRGLKDIEAELIRKTVLDTRGNVMEAARRLGISRATVYRKLGRRG